VPMSPVEPCGIGSQETVRARGARHETTFDSRALSSNVGRTDSLAEPVCRLVVWSTCALRPVKRWSTGLVERVAGASRFSRRPDTAVRATRSH